MFDAVVIGARCAGSPTAMLLAGRGHRVLLVDKATFPSDTINGHFIHPPGVARLRRWGLLDNVAALGCPPISTWLFDAGPITLRGSPPPTDGTAAVSYAPRRLGLDKVLLDGAGEAGAELRERFTVSELLFDGDRVTGIRGRAVNGRTVTERARIVVGADGMRSLVARTVEAPEYRTQPTLTCAYYSYWSGARVTGAEVYARDQRVVIAFPAGPDLTAVFIAWPVAEFHAFRADIERNFLATLDLAPGLAERVRGGERVHHFVGSAILPNFFRRPYGPGWALVGDAGYHKDPYLAQGINDAFRDAELVAEAIDEGLAGPRELAEALGDYERRRNAEAMPRYELNVGFARLEPPPPEMQQMLTSMAGDQAAIDRFWGVLMSILPVQELYRSPAESAA